MSKWSIFGAGPGGLYTAWRLLDSGKLAKGDTLELFDGGNYQFGKAQDGTRAAAGRICTYHYKGDRSSSYVEVGGMRYIHWEGNPDGAGHRLVTTVIDKLDLEKYAVPFGTISDPLFFLRGKHFYSSEISPDNPAPYDADHGLAGYPPNAGTVSAYNYVAQQALGDSQATTRKEQCAFFEEGKVPAPFQSSVFKSGSPLRDIGYWNLMYDQLGSEGYDYAAAGGGYQSNVINWNSADALIYNSEFSPGGTFKTLKNGYSSIFSTLFETIEQLAKDEGVDFVYRHGTRLRSIWLDPKNRNAITYTLAAQSAPYQQLTLDGEDEWVTQYAFLAMPPGAIDTVAEGSRYMGGNIVDVLNDEQVVLARGAVIKQPSYKVAMFFDEPWWEDSNYPPRQDEPSDFGPTITDQPLRQVYYFGNNGANETPPVYALLASYDDERFVRFWQELEVPANQTRTVPVSEDRQPLEGPRQAPDAMVAMLRKQLANLHYGEGAPATTVPKPLETVFMDWSLKPFSAGYHAWAAHYDIGEVMQKIRRPTDYISGVDANLFIVGSAYSNDQAWVEGAFCTSESVLNDFLDVPAIINADDYPFICRCGA